MELLATLFLLIHIDSHHFYIYLKVNSTGHPRIDIIDIMYTFIYIDIDIDIINVVG